MKHSAGMVAILLLLTVVAGAGATRLSFADDYQEVFRTGRSDFRLLEETGRQFPGDGQEVVLLVQSADVLTPAAVELLRRLTARLERLDGIERVDSPTAISALPGLAAAASDADPGRRETLRRAVLAHPLLGGHLVAPGLDGALLVAHLDPRLRSLAAIEPVLAGIGELATQASAPGVTVSWTGLPRLRSEIVRSVQRDQLVFTATGVLLGALIILAVFRHPAPALLAGAGPLVGTIWTVGAMGWLGEPIDVMNNVVPVLVLVTGMTDSVHLVREFQRLRADGLAQHAAARRALRTVGPACALASLTTILAFSSLALADFGIVRRLGLACAGGLALSLLAVLAVFAQLAGHSRLGRPLSPAATRLAPGIATGLHASRRAARGIAVGSVVVLLLSAVSIVWLRPDYRYREYLPAASPALRGLQAIEKSFGGFFPLRVVVDWPAGATDTDVLTALDTAERVLAASPITGAPFSILTFLRAAAGNDAAVTALPAPTVIEASARRAVWRPDLRRALVTSRAPGLGAAALEPHFRELEAALAAAEAGAPGFRFRLSGLLPVSSRASVRMISTLARSLALASLLIFLTLGVAVRSTRLALLSLPPNLLPLGAICAWLAITGRPLQFTSVTLLTVVLGIAVDDTIHLLAAYRRALAGGREVEAAIAHAVESVGGSLIATSCLFCAGFAAVGLSRAPLMSLFGWLAALALAVALLADLVLLPALLQTAFVRRSGAEIRR